MKKITFLMIAILSLFLTLSPTSDAKKKKKSNKDHSIEGRSFGISPISTDLDCKAGNPQSVTFRVENPGKHAIAVSAETIGYVIDPGKNGLEQRQLSALSESNLARNMQVSPSRIIVPGSSYKEVTASLNVPTSLKGTQYTGVRFSQTAMPNEELDVYRREEFEKNTGVGVLPALAATIKCHISGTLHHAFDIQSLVIPKKSSNKPIIAKLKVKNTGNAELKFVPLIILLDNSKKIVARMKGQEAKTLAPGSHGEMNLAPYYQNIAPGNYNAIINMQSSEMSVKPVQKSVKVR